MISKSPPTLFSKRSESTKAIPEYPILLARAWESSDSEKATAALERALELNPNHVPSLLYRADAAIDREQYDAAEKMIRQVHAINPHEQEAWALLAVIAHLRGDYEKEKSMRESALKTWANNPRVDHLIGMKLSQKYRFEEGAEYQRKALEFDPQYAPASFQLAQDLLRLGHEEVGWKLAQRYRRRRQIQCRRAQPDDALRSAQGIQHSGSRRHPRANGIPRSAVFTAMRSWNCSSEAKTVLCEKYDVEPRAPIVVEIFPEQKDFAIRTFGLPGGAGFLGVCFGRVITANSPASQGERPSNWQSVLWHEFCHVVTLEKTKNRMPRWLSEGISVYEERQRDPSWGESMTPIYREMLLGDDLTPVSDLSAAFLNPASPIHLQFAYYESSLVIEFLIDRYGIDALKQILDDLGDGLTINDALVRSVGSLQKLDSQFEEFAHQQAESFGSEADWSREEMPEKPTPQELATWVQQHPTNYWGLRAMASAYVAAKQYDLAKPPLEKLKSLDTMTGERGDPLEMLARVYRELDQADAERETLTADCITFQRCVARSAAVDRTGARRRRLGIGRGVRSKFNSINPLLAEGHLSLAEAAEKSDRPIEALRSLGALCANRPVDPAALDYRMAIALSEVEQYDLAKHHVLRALDEAPRYRDAHRLLLKLSQQGSAAQQADGTTKTDDNQVESQ